MCRTGIMLAISSGYKNDLVCTQRKVSSTSFILTARVGFITLLLTKHVREGRKNERFYTVSLFVFMLADARRHLCISPSVFQHLTCSIEEPTRRKAFTSHSGRISGPGARNRGSPLWQTLLLIKCYRAIIVFVPLNSLTFPWPSWMPAAQSWNLI